MRGPAVRIVVTLAILIVPQCIVGQDLIPGLPEVDSEGLMREVETQQRELLESLRRTDDVATSISEMLVGGEDREVRLRRRSVAAIAAAKSGDPEASSLVARRGFPTADTEHIPLALARHRILVDLGDQELRDASLRSLWPPEGAEVGDLDRLLAHYAAVLAGLGAIAPGSEDVAQCLASLGMVCRRSGDLRLAVTCHERSLEIWEDLAPDSEAAARAHWHVAVLHDIAGDLDRALAHYQQSLSIFQGLRHRPNASCCWGAFSPERAMLLRIARPSRHPTSSSSRTTASSTGQMTASWLAADA